MVKKFQIFFLENIILLTVLISTGFAFLLPTLGHKLNQLSLTTPLIMIVFFCQGTGIIRLKFDNVKEYSKAIIFGFIISQIIFPIAAFCYVKAFGWQGDSLVGMMLICCMAPTLVSGAIISEQAGGDKTASLMLTIFINLFAVFLVPFNLAWTLGAEVNLEVLPLLSKLIYLVLIPAILGYIFKLKKEKVVGDYKSVFKYLPVVCLGLVIFISMSEQVASMHNLTWKLFIEYTIASVILHLLLLSVGFYGALALGLRRNIAKSIAICCSQKTIPITVALWSSFFSHFSLALLPAMVFHLVQIYCDGVLAKKWSKEK